MGKSAMNWLAAGALSMLCLAGCKSATKPAAGLTDGGGAGTGADTDSGVGPEPDAININCPNYIGPSTGPYAQKGTCCYRTANSTRVDAQGDGDKVEVEYRLNYIQTTNHPKSIGQETLRMIGQSRSENEEQSILWRFIGPRKNGKAESGRGTVTIGSGRYNCDGTYSYYSKTAAPGMKFGRGAERWVAPIVPVSIDATKTDPAERTVADWDTDSSRGYTLTPYLSSADFTLDWELVNQGFTIEKMPTDDTALNCIGERTSAAGWKAGGTFIVYTPIDVNNTDPIGVLNGQTYCQLVAFGVLNSDLIHDPSVSCAPGKVPRCEPGSKNCKWLKLPDSLCPVDAAEQKNWACHIGDENNPDKEPTNCTAAAPTGSLDPAKGGKSKGQCCDPLGTSKTLPACNSYFLRNEFVAAAADITDKLEDTVQPNCHGK